MTVETTIDWNSIRQEIEMFCGIPDGLESNGISAIRAMIYRRRGGVAQRVLDVKHGEVGLLLEGLLHEYADFWFDNMEREAALGLFGQSISAKGLVTIEMLGDLIMIEYTPVEGREQDAEKLAGALLLLVGNYANRNQ
jgi:hypothetical protein